MPSESQKGLNSQVCNQCGKCCIHYVGQIYYRKEEIDNLSRESIPHPLYQWFFDNRNHFLGTRFKKPCYYLPAWKDVEKFMPNTLKEQYQPKTISPNACIFLEFRSDAKTYCLIHTIKSAVCQEYPAFKANACLNHLERRYTKEFFESQLLRTKLQMQFIKDLYGNYVQNPRVFDLMTLMLDQGEFDHELLYDFLARDWNLSKEEFQGLLIALENLQLIIPTLRNSKLGYESITTDDIKKMADLFVNATENSTKSEK